LHPGLARRVSFVRASLSRGQEKLYFGLVPQPQMRCPACQDLDWSRDGYRIRMLEDDTLQIRRVAEAADATEPWICASCGYRVVTWGMLHARLNGARVGERE